MAFVNEFIPKEDFEKYALNDIDNQHIHGGARRRDWTIDRERDIYLRKIAAPHDADFTVWTFYWKGELLWFEKFAPYGPSVLGADGRRYSRTVVRNMKLPPHLEGQRQEIYQDMRNAFLVYGGGGMYYQGTDYVNQIEFEE